MSERMRCFVPSVGGGGLVIFILFFFFFHCSQSGRTAGAPGTGEKHLRARTTTRPKLARANITRRKGVPAAAPDVCVCPAPHDALLSTHIIDGLSRSYGKNDRTAYTRVRVPAKEIMTQRVTR